MGKRLKTAALFLCAVGLSLAIGEAAVRLFRPEFVRRPDQLRNPFWEDWTEFWRHDPVVGWKLRPGAEGTFTSKEFSHQVRINSAGWRDLERSVGRTPGRFRVAVIGDSFTWGPGVPDDQLFTRQMERLLPEVEVLNFGLSATSTDQQLLILRGDVLTYAPDLVLLVITRNDFDGIIESMSGPYHKPFFVLNEDGTLVPKNQPVPEISRGVRLARWLEGVSALSNLVSASWSQSRPEPAETRKAENARSFALMRALLKTMRDDCLHAGARFVMALAPSDSHVYPETISSLETVRMRELDAIAAAERIPYLDLVPAFRQAAREGGDVIRSRFHYPLDRHWNLEGHTLAARELARLLQERRLLEPAQATP